MVFRKTTPNSEKIEILVRSDLTTGAETSNEVFGASVTTAYLYLMALRPARRPDAVLNLRGRVD